MQVVPLSYRLQVKFMLYWTQNRSDDLSCDVDIEVKCIVSAQWSFETGLSNHIFSLKW
jgi:hypothetical protein